MHFEKVSFEAFKRDVHDYYGGMPDDEIKEIYDNIVLPERKTKYSAAYDVATPIPVLILPGQSRVIPTGIKAVFAEEEMETWCLKLYARSSIGIKDKVVVTNAVGIIDSDYTGEVIVSIHNDSTETKTIQRGERIAQLVIVPYLSVIFDEVDELDETERGTGGFGSTGEK